MNVKGGTDDEVAWNSFTYTSDRRAPTHLSVIQSAPCEWTSVMLIILFANYLFICLSPSSPITYPSDSGLLHSENPLVFHNAQGTEWASGDLTW